VKEPQPLVVALHAMVRILVTALGLAPNLSRWEIIFSSELPKKTSTTSTSMDCKCPQRTGVV
jgi:hypothetical protein